MEERKEIKIITERRMKFGRKAGRGGSEGGTEGGREGGRKEEAFNIRTLGYWKTLYFPTGKSRGISPQWQSQNTRRFCQPGWSQSYERRDSPTVQFVKQSVGTWISFLHLINVPFGPFGPIVPGTNDIKKRIIWNRTRIKTFYLTNRQINTVKHDERVIN